MVTVDCVSDARAMLGEGPSWDAATGLLFWVDIIGGAIHLHDPLLQRDRVITLGEFVSAVVPRQGGGVVAVLQHGFAHVDLDSERVTMLATVEEDMPTNRFNDAKCDAQGRLWAGTMDRDETRPVGALYCLEPDLSVRQVLSGITVSNGIGWSPDHRLLYYVDSPTKRVMAYDFDLSAGTLGRGREVFTVDDGFPDGLAVDAQGMIWLAHWDGYKVTRFDPYAGKILQELRLPAARVTSCAFAGPELQDLYITTARTGIADAELAATPLAGGLFRALPGVQGQKTYAFAG